MDRNGRNRIHWMTGKMYTQKELEDIVEVRRPWWTCRDKKGMEREKEELILIRDAMTGKIKKVTKEEPTR